MGCRVREEEQGIYLVIVAAVIVALFFISSYALESGYLYVNRLRVQRVVDAAVTNGAFYYYELLARDTASDGHDIYWIRDEAANEIFQHIQMNLKSMGIKYDPAQFAQLTRTLCPDDPPPPVDTRPISTKPPMHAPKTPPGTVTAENFAVSVCNDGITVNGAVQVEPLILGFLLRNSAKTAVDGKAESALKPAAITLVLDDSFSMEKSANPDYYDMPHYDGDTQPDPLKAQQCADLAQSENCREVCPGEDVVGHGTQCYVSCDNPFFNMNCSKRVHALKYATKEFIKTLLPGDQLAIVNFSNTGNVLVSLRPVLEFVGQNVSLATCFAQYPGTQAWPKECFMAALDGEMDQKSDYHGLVAQGKTNIYDGLRLGIGEIAKATDEQAKMKFMLAFTDGFPDGGQLRSKWEEWYGTAEGDTLFKEFYEWSSVNKSGQSNLAMPANYHDPIDPRTLPHNDPDRCLGERPNDENGGYVQNLKRQFTSAINILDQAREQQNLHVYSVGLGPEQTNFDDAYQKGWTDCQPDDVYQIFLHRLALDNPSQSHPTWPQFQRATGNPFPGARKYEETSGNRGEYYHAQNGEELGSIMAGFGKQLRTFLKQ